MPRPPGPPPTRREPWEGLAPRDFDPKWPYGDITAPAKLRDLGLNETQIASHVAGVEELRDLVLDYESYLKREGKKQDSVARDLNLSVDTIVNLRKGSTFASPRTILVLRGNIPFRPKREGGRGE